MPDILLPAILLEVCVDTAEGLEAAIAGGADRIELCSSLGEGGLTPSAGLMALAGRQSLPVRAMIRPRAGDFTFDAAEVAVMRDDIKAARDAGLAGVVIGAIDAAGALDRAVLEGLMAAASGMGVTLHRAVDLLPSPREAVEVARALGIDTILTSGGALKAPEGNDEILAMVRRAGPDLTILAGSGLRAENVGALVAATGVRAVHASCSGIRDGGDPRAVAMGFAPPRRSATDRAAVERMRRVLDDLAKA
ncbi:copper homeostasis protein CutC [Novosphingobium sp.]|uniref:copper homeostasis protein CutC n=1 Tax=Novosphingobium sp. TaxID=1874826 RepID=UPI0031D3C2B8